MRYRILSLAAVSFLGLAASLLGWAGETHPDLDYDAWKRRPAEAFSDGEAMFRRVKQILSEKYYRKGITDDELYRAAVQGMLENVDPAMARWNKLLSPTEVAELQADMAGEIVGAGAAISFDPPSGMATVIEIVPGSPAAKAGLKVGDRILKVDGRFFVGKQLRDVVYAIRGKEGQSRRLTLLRQDKILEPTLRLQRIAYAEVTSQSLPGAIGLVGIRYFTNGTPAKVRAALEGLRARKVRALIVDLRGNQGGLLEKTLESASLFLPKGQVVVRLQKRDTADEPVRAAGEPVLPGVPLAVLVNEQTGSGAEILSMALKEDLGATLIGTHTAGKWSVQSVDDLPNRFAVKYTIGTFQTPAGQEFAGRGIPPDIEVAQDPQEVERLQKLTGLEERLTADAPLRAGLRLLGEKL